MARKNPSGARAVGGREAALAPPRTAGSALDQLTTDPDTECAPGIQGAGGACSSGPVLEAITSFVVTRGGVVPGQPSNTTPREANGAPVVAPSVAPAAELLSCNSEACVIGHPEFVKHVAKTQGTAAARQLAKEKLVRFKPQGPRNSTALLSNYDIDSVLEQWAVEFPRFFNYEFAMMDFAKTGAPIERIDIGRVLEGNVRQSLGAAGAVKRACDTAACVLNTDVSTGPGKHWVAVFVDCRGDGPWTVEYFNSAGNPPPREVTTWAEEIAARLAEVRRGRGSNGPVNAVYLTGTRHQNGNTECGLYALYFIRRRLEGAPHTDFQVQGGRITDREMTEFRKHVFRT